MRNFEILADALEEGLILVDQEERIRTFNRRAKEIMGVIYDINFMHPQGKLERGDIVLIADNALGVDDGKLEAKDLELLGIYDQRIRKNSALLVLGVYGEDEASYKFFHEDTPMEQLSLEARIRGFDLRASILSSAKILRLEVEDRTFDVGYMHSFGHMVVLDSKGKLKFAQSKGYSYRKEGIGELLRGASYQAKSAKEEGQGSQGYQAEELFGRGVFLNSLRELLEGKKKKISARLFEVHQRQIVASLSSLELEGGRYVAVNLRDASKLRDLLEERNQILSALEKSLNTRIRLETDFEHSDQLIGISARMKEIKYLIARASTISSNVLITGENGTGKTLVAREIHRIGKKDLPFVEVNCGSIPHTLFESELFGYVGGSFTGALPQGKEGFFDQAQGGTIFLDEISEIPPFIQSKLLHVIQDKKYYPLGSSQPRTLNARIIAASNRRLEREIEEGRFREDLYFRLNVFPINIPSIKERRDDLYLLVKHIKTRISQQLSIVEKEISGSAMKEILNYEWPGNIRELENVLERALIVCGGDIIYPEHLNITRTKSKDFTLRGRLEEAEKKIFEEVTTITEDKKEMMEMLDISKASLYEKLKKHGLS